MKLKTFTAKSMPEAMAQVRNVMGDDAIIVSSEEGKRIGGVRIVAAVEARHRPQETAKGKNGEAKKPATRPGKEPIRPYDRAELRAILTHHGLPHALSERIMTAAEAINAPALIEALTAAFDTVLNFQPLADRPHRPIALIGPSGAGKTAAAAKIAAEAVLNGRSVSLITTDTDRSGGIEQLDRFARLMNLSLATAAYPEELGAVIQAIDKAGANRDITLIDTRGANPFSPRELAEAHAFVEAAGAEPVLVLPAGTDAEEAADIALSFAEVGVQRLIATRLDAARRFAGPVNAARSGRLALAAFSRSPFVAEGLETATPLMLARLFSALPQPIIRKTAPSPSSKQSAAK
ncbi:MAG: hypothetical protein MI755_19675 [Sphingomonadales bacterium]|nr:hypothetical protein [Sphingomonadales bacterium]